MNTPLAERLRIVLCGKTNAGKSSLLNCLIGKEEAIVSARSGTTTDPVTRNMELFPLGPVALTDTAGFFDDSVLGYERQKKTRDRVATADVILFVSTGHEAPEPAETGEFEKLRAGNKNMILVLTHAGKDLHPGKKAWTEIGAVRVDCVTAQGRDDLIRELNKLSRTMRPEPGPLEGLVKEGDFLLLVTPIDLAAPKARLILPQVETIRDALDRDCVVTVVKERELAQAYANWRNPPALVITDSQAFSKVSADLPRGQKLTSFSILFARKKGGLATMVEGLKALDRMKPGARIMVLEACSHHRQADDIATVKIPRLYRQLVHSDADFFPFRGMPEQKDLLDVDLVIHCGGCMITRNQMLERLERAGRNDIPVTNFGLFLSWANGLFPRALEPLPEFEAIPSL